MRLIPQSLRGRLLVSLLVPLALIGLIGLLNSRQEAATISTSVSDRVLAGSALAIAERVVVTENGTLDVDIPYAALEMLTSTAQDNVFYRVEGPPGNFITGYADLPRIPDSGPNVVEEIEFMDGEFRGTAVRIAMLRRAGSSGLAAIPFEVTVAETTLSRGLLSDSIIVNSAIRLALLIAAAIAIALISVSLSIRPLYRLSESIAQRSPSELGRIDDEVPTEVRGLVDTINNFMDRLGTSIDALRHFTGNASHQLRTPLAIIRTQLALARRATSSQQAKAALDDGDEAVVHAERVLAQLMLLARVDEAVSQTREADRVNLTLVARELVADLIPLACSVDIDLGYEGDQTVHVLGDEILLGEMLRNLIDNALKYAGKGASVTVSVIESGGLARLCVEDTGAGIPLHLQGDVRKRFLRGRSSGQGSGLGLAIVDEIAALFGGALTIGNGRNGTGLLAAITLPAAPDAQ
ncbi:two-component system, OmpR family, sensor histidine kinase TctE [Devosia lucknowensis]|uniref:histidine kinase n=1 Tax=Devosia lucknowensis TaxID=1096929 RepID=A0A1Y6F255_9HYPH|nr:sensor histidine kinase [Devosia lucknowensis]SMQ68659.1 two-component system, OmpR family, sensor histidine kinase TctE [Devosia lucknowensis]